MSGNVANVKEVAGAIAFLQYLHADWHNNYLILAVVAWLHAESGGLKNVIGNNPFNLRPGKDDLKFRSGIRRSKKGNGYFSVYKSMEAGFRAAANRLLTLRAKYGYGLIVTSAQAVRGNTAAEQQSVAQDFLYAIALSAWDASHYGITNNDPTTSHLYRIWITFTGLDLPNPKQPKRRPPTPAPKPLPVIQPPNLRAHFPDPYDALRFYRGRPHGLDGLPKLY